MAYFVTADLIPRITDGRFPDCGPNCRDAPRASAKPRASDETLLGPLFSDTFDADTFDVSLHGATWLYTFWRILAVCLIWVCVHSPISDNSILPSTTSPKYTSRFLVQNVIVPCCAWRFPLWQIVRHWYSIFPQRYWINPKTKRFGGNNIAAAVIRQCGCRDTTALQPNGTISPQGCRAVTPWQPKTASNLEHNDFEYQHNINHKKALHCCYNTYWFLIWKKQVALKPS